MIRGENGRLRYYAEPASSPGKPVVIMLHGIGERSATNLDLVLRYGPLKILKDGGSLPDATYVQPQLPSGLWDADEIASLFKHITSTYQGDEKSWHLTGVSLGGLGTRMYLASPHGKSLASAVMMSPGGGLWSESQINAIADSGVPLWISHAINDTLKGALYTTTLDAVSRLKAKGTKAELRFTTFGLSGHTIGSAWGRFMNPSNFYIWEWIVSHRKPEEVPAPLPTPSIEQFKTSLIDFISSWNG